MTCSKCTPNILSTRESILNKLSTQTRRLTPQPSIVPPNRSHDAATTIPKQRRCHPLSLLRCISACHTCKCPSKNRPSRICWAACDIWVPAGSREFRCPFYESLCSRCTRSGRRCCRTIRAPNSKGRDLSGRTRNWRRCRWDRISYRCAIVFRGI